MTPEMLKEAKELFRGELSMLGYQLASCKAQGQKRHVHNLEKQMDRYERFISEVDSALEQKP